MRGDISACRGAQCTWCPFFAGALYADLFPHPTVVKKPPYDDNSLFRGRCPGLLLCGSRRSFALLHRLDINDDPLRQHDVAFLQEIHVVTVSKFVQCCCVVTDLVLCGCECECAQGVHVFEFIHTFIVKGFCDGVPLSYVFCVLY